MRPVSSEELVDVAEISFSDGAASPPLSFPVDANEFELPDRSSQTRRRPSRGSPDIATLLGAVDRVTPPRESTPLFEGSTRGSLSSPSDSSDSSCLGLTLGYGAALFNTITAVVGAGILGFSYAFAWSGFTTAVICTIVVGLLCFGTLYIVVRASQQTKARGYQDIMGRLFADSPSKWPLLVTQFIVFVYLQGACVVYLTVVFESLHPVLDSYIEPEVPDRFYKTKPFLVLFVAVVIEFPLSLFSGTEFLAPASFISVSGAIYLVFFVVVEFLRDTSVVESNAEAAGWGKFYVFNDVMLFGAFPGAVLSLPTISFAFQIHGCIVPIVKDFPKRFPSKTVCKFMSVAAIALVFVTLMYLLVGVCGFFLFGHSVVDNVIPGHSSNLHGVMSRGRSNLPVWIPLRETLPLFQSQNQFWEFGFQNVGVFQSKNRFALPPPSHAKSSASTRQEMSLGTGLPPRIGILCSGGPAPGFNSVISSVAIEGIENGYQILGFLEGFKYLQTGGHLLSPQHYKVLTREEVSRIIYEGGSVIRTSRANPKNFDPEDSDKGFHNVIEALENLNCMKLVTIGGDDTSTSANRLHETSGGRVKVVHVPKTIDNDLPLPGGAPTFGFQTARDLGSHLVQNLMTDANTYARFFLVIAMGRAAGHLALGIGKGSSAPLTLIPEEFLHTGSDRVSFKLVCDIIEGCIVKRRMFGRDNGVCVLAEGLLANMDPAELREKFGEDEVQVDSFGNLKLDLLDFGYHLKREMVRRVKARGLSVAFTAKKLGYELRCEPPNTFDRIYTRDLGYGACRQLIDEDLPGGQLVYIESGAAMMMPFAEIPRDETGHTCVRTVDCTAEDFQVARAYMVRLKTKDFRVRGRMEALAVAGRFDDVDHFMEYFADVQAMEAQW